ncbi:hypothetical protein VTN31DRAFT_807 [Thermomyces dupontii]|uniref:uncharacterized protein n=1 Tax=Talaromyces thermophilus TaxID=28565 RepID=UPI003743C80B
MARQGVHIPQSQMQQETLQRKLPTYTIAIKDFVSLAEYIAGQAKVAVRVPTSFISALNRAIAVRRSYGAEITSRLPKIPQVEESNQRHNYFIRILEHVRDVLRPWMPSEQRDEGPDQLANRFEKLEVEEPSEAFVQTANVPPAKKDENAEQPDANYVAERLQDIEEAYFAFMLMIQDFNKLRSVINQTWAGYKMGAFSLVAASLTMNTALDLARGIEEEIKEVLDKHGGSEKLLVAYFLALCMERGENEAYREKPGDGMKFRMYEDTKNFYWPTYMLLRSFADLVVEGQVPQYKPGYYGTYDPKSDRSAKDARGKFLEDQQILMEILTDFAYLCKAGPDMPAEEELTRGLREMFKTKQIPYWLLFAVQVFLDIHHELREDVDRGYEDLRNVAVTVNNSIENVAFKFHESLRIENWPRQIDQILRRIMADIETFVLTDIVQEIKKKIRMPLGEPFRLQRWHPVFCGLWSYNFLARYQEAGVAFAGAWGSILYTYHLYNALRQEKLLQVQWKDMEVFEMLHGDQIFPGGPPRTPEDYPKRFCLSMGYSATAFARDRRNPTRLEASKKGRMGFQELAPVMRIFKDRFCLGTGQRDLTKAELDKILSASNWELMTGGAEGQEDILEFERKGKHTVTAKSDSEKKRLAESSRVEMTDLLRNLRNALQVEMLEFSFPYLIFHQSCWIALRHIKMALEERLRSIYGVGCIERENQLPFIVGYIFMAATNTQRLTGVLSPKKKAVTTSALMAQAAAECNAALPGGAGEFAWKVMTELMRMPFELQEEVTDDE